VYFAQHKGLVLDEFHTLFHASRQSVGALLESLRGDNHPPLAVLLVRASQALFGDSPLALRLPAICCGCLEMVLVASVARRWLGMGTALAVGLVAASSLHLDFSTQVRMYALLSLSVTGLLRTLLNAMEQGGRHWCLAGWIVLGVHAHYYFFLYGGLLVVMALCPMLGEAQGRARVRALMPALITGVALCLPWCLWGLTQQVAHGLPPGGDDLGWHGLAEAMAHLLFLNVRIGGEGLRLVLIASAGLGLGLGALGAWALIREHPRRATGVLLATAAFGVPLAALTLATLVPRAGFTWHYILPSLPALALLIARASETGLPARLASSTVIAGALVLSTLNLRGPGTEDYPGAVNLILDEHQVGDLVVCVEWQPPLFPTGMPWDYYSGRLSADPPRREEMNGSHLRRPDQLNGASQVFVLASRLPKEHGLILLLEEQFALRKHTNFGFGREVYVYSRRD
jgi:mannosyltransferase